MSRRLRSSFSLALALVAAGCERRGEYADSANPKNPAMVNDTSTTGGHPDSTAGVSERTGRPGVSGDSSRARTQGTVPEKKP